MKANDGTLLTKRGSAQSRDRQNDCFATAPWHGVLLSAAKCNRSVEQVTTQATFGCTSTPMKLARPRHPATYPPDHANIPGVWVDHYTDLREEDPQMTAPNTRIHFLHSTNTHTQAHRLTGSQAHRLTGSQAHRLTGSQAHRLTGSQAHRLTGSQAHNSLLNSLLTKAFQEV